LFIKNLLIKFSLFLIICSGVSSAQDQKFINELNTLLSDSFFNYCNVGVKVYNLTQKKELFSLNPYKLMNPASNQKILTSIAGLIYLGEDFKFKTKIGYRGKIVNSVLQGDLIIVGGCDPDFKLDSLNKISEVLKLAGIKKINGNILADISIKDSLFWGEGWMWDDDGEVTSPFMSALNVNGNSVFVSVSPGKFGGKPIVALSPSSKYFEIVNSAVTNQNGSDLKVWRDYLDRTNKIFVKGNMNQASAPMGFIFNVWKPEIYLLKLIEEKLEQSGISISGKLDVIYTNYDFTSLYEFQHPYKYLINQLNKHSDNLYTEMVLLALGNKTRAKNVSYSDGKRYIDSVITWVGLNPANFRISDGSGVSRYNVVNVTLLNSLLNKIYYRQDTLFQIYYNSLPIAGVDGTLSGRMKNGLCYNNLHAKTGTLSGVSALSGYVKAASGDMISFSILMQNFTGSAGPARSFQDKICEIIAKFN
jgi:D-alanyl-D-alanine carboxypeptidase/D-alanyl-D-alanine-endopeptidase (penicillin-binding protein 4)